MDSCIVCKSHLNGVLQKQIDAFLQRVSFLFGLLHSISTEVTMEMFELNLSLATECESHVSSGLYL